MNTSFGRGIVKLNTLLIVKLLSYPLAEQTQYPGAGWLINKCCTKVVCYADSYQQIIIVKMIIFNTAFNLQTVQIEISSSNPGQELTHCSNQSIQTNDQVLLLFYTLFSTTNHANRFNTYVVLTKQFPYTLLEIEFPTRI